MTKHWGFAAMDAEARRRIASKGGKTAHLKGRAHEWSKEQAREAGRKGGASTARRKATTDANPVNQE